MAMTAFVDFGSMLLKLLQSVSLFKGPGFNDLELSPHGEAGSGQKTVTVKQRSRTKMGYGLYWEGPG